MAMGMLYDKFDYNAFTSGQLDKEQEELYYKFLDRKESMEPLIIDTATTVSAVRAKVEQNESDIVFVDSAYLMEDEEGAEADHMRVTHIFRGLKKMAKCRKFVLLFRLYNICDVANIRTITITNERRKHRIERMLAHAFRCCYRYTIQRMITC